MFMIRTDLGIFEEYARVRLVRCNDRTGKPFFLALSLLK